MVTKLAALESEVKALGGLIARPQETLIVRHRSTIVHQSAVEEQQNEPVTWHTRCGWYYMAASDFSECRPSPTSSVGVRNVSSWNIAASSPQKAGPMQMNLGAPARVPPTVS